jgi:hypothetical protein
MNEPGRDIGLPRRRLAATLAGVPRPGEREPSRRARHLDDIGPGRVAVEHLAGGTVVHRHDEVLVGQLHADEQSLPLQA